MGGGIFSAARDEGGQEQQKSHSHLSEKLDQHLKLVQEAMIAGKKNSVSASAASATLETQRWSRPNLVERIPTTSLLPTHGAVEGVAPSSMSLRTTIDVPLHHRAGVEDVHHPAHRSALAAVVGGASQQQSARPAWSESAETPLPAAIFLQRTGLKCTTNINFFFPRFLFPQV